MYTVTAPFDGKTIHDIPNFMTAHMEAVLLSMDSLVVYILDEDENVIYTLEKEYELLA